MQTSYTASPEVETEALANQTKGFNRKLANIHLTSLSTLVNLNEAHCMTSSN